MLSKKLFACLVFALVLASCAKEDTRPNEETILDSSETEVSVATERSSRRSTVQIQHDPDGPPTPLSVVTGASSTLTRSPNGISGTFRTSGLIPGNAYTLWFVIFGENPGPPVLVTYATGHVVGASGKGNFAAHLSVNDVFDNPLTGEVHMTLRSHGPARPEAMPDQIQTIDGGCIPGIAIPSGPTMWPDSDVVGYCANIQVAMHPRN